MNNYIFKEAEYVENLMQAPHIDDNKIVSTISSLARYNHFVINLTPDENRKAINAFMKQHSDVYNDITYFTIVNKCIKRVEKNPWRDIDTIKITKSELDRIVALHDIAKEKIAFVLLADAKYTRAWKHHEYTSSFLRLPALFKMARVTTPAAERKSFFGFMIDEGLIAENLNPKSTARDLLFIDDDSPVELELTESSYLELAYTYMWWRSGRTGYKPCEKCGRLIKTSNRGERKYCIYCAEKPVHPAFKTVQCIDCGADVLVNGMDYMTCRCQTCNEIYQKQRDAAKHITYRARQKQ